MTICSCFSLVIVGDKKLIDIVIGMLLNKLLMTSNGVKLLESGLGYSCGFTNGKINTFVICIAHLEGDADKFVNKLEALYSPLAFEVKWEEHARVLLKK